MTHSNLAVTPITTANDNLNSADRLGAWVFKNEHLDPYRCS